MQSPPSYKLGETALEYMSSAAKLLSTAGPNQASLWKSLLAAGCLAQGSGGENQGDANMSLHAIGSSPGYSGC